MIKRILVATLAATAGLGVASAHATAVVSVATPVGIYAPVDVTLDAPGAIRVNSAALDASGGHYVVSGPCVLDHGPGNNSVPSPVIGATCTGPGSVHFRTTGQLTSTCAYDGAILEGLHLTIKVDGVVQYDQQLWPNPMVCYVTPAPPASTTWSPTTGALTFTNARAARTSAETIFTLAQSAWDYSAHTFTVPAGVTCSSNLVHVGTRYVWHWAELGFRCSAAVPANTSLAVTVT